MMDVSLRWIVLAVMLGVMSLDRTLAMQITTRPAGRDGQATVPQAGPDQEQIRRWVLGLSDPDPVRREQARYHLLGLNRDDLSNLQAVVRALGPMEHALVEELHQIVTHVYLAGDEYERVPRGFLGISMPQLAVEQVEQKLEVTIERRMPGFCGFRALRDGDAVVDIVERPLAQGDQPGGFRRNFRNAILAFRPAQTIHLKVLRRGQIIRVPVTLDAAPAAVLVDNEVMTRQFLDRRGRIASEYWQKNFEPLVSERPVGPAAQTDN